MGTNEHPVVVGIFHERTEAQQAIRELKQEGFREEQIGVLARNVEGEIEVNTQQTPTGAKLAAGAGVGAAAGAGIGVLWALGIATLGFPPLGPILVGGTLLAAILASAGSGAVVGSLLGVLIGLGVPEEEAAYYEREIHAGRTVVTVHAEGRTEEAWNILSRCGAYNMHREAEGVAGTPTQSERV